MATIVLGTVGGIVGGAIGGPLGAVVGRALGALGGSLIDQQIVNALTPPQRREGPRLTTTDIQASTEGAPIGRCYGRVRLPGNIIWATRYLEEITTETTGGGKGASPQPTVVTTTYRYYANFAVGICEGPVAGFGRIWADGKEIEPALYTIRRYLGTESQVADPLIEAKEGEAPAYRGLAYLVFEGLPIAEWGNRIPQIAVEVFRPTGGLEEKCQAIAVIAGNEFLFDTQQVTVTSSGGGVAENRHTLLAETDFVASIDRLEMLCPNLQSVMLVCPWFADDLRVGEAEIKPMVDTGPPKTTDPAWVVSGLTRATAPVVSYIDGSASSGGSPNDASVIRAIQMLNARGIDVTLFPFIATDIAAGNTLPDPHSDNAAGVGQPPYPWRGRMTVSPAFGYEGSVDGTEEAAAQVAAFLGTCEPSDFSAAGTTVTYSGPDEWSYRRLILHYATLAALAGGVEAFVLGSEMVELSTVRDENGDYPFVQGLITLAGEVAAILPDAKLTYSADWLEWNNHRPADESGDVIFHLDPLWADDNIDFIGVDNYMPLADWRDGSSHLDFDPSGPTSIYDRDYLMGNVAGGERFDWLYLSEADRVSQTRTAIVDPLDLGEEWMFRQKDLKNWWLNEHYNRPGGVRDGSPTAWVPQSKPFRFMEFGCPAVDKGANQPNIFPDPKSVEGGYPYFSSRARDDVMQRAHLEAIIDFYSIPANNPVSEVYGGPMLDLSHSNLWTWDCRPWPHFPLDNYWGDAPNWDTGHWLSGRFGGAPARETIEAILDEAGFASYAVEPIGFSCDGITVGGIMSARSLLDALRPAYQCDAVESDGVIKFVSRLGRAPFVTLDTSDLVLEDGDSPRTFRMSRAQETELPDAIKLSFGDPARDDQPASIEARRSAGGSLRVVEHRPPVVLSEPMARSIAELELHAAWVGRERAEFTLPPSRLALDPGDVVTFAPTQQTLRLASISDGLGRAAEAFAVDPLAHRGVEMPRSAGRTAPNPVLLDPQVLLIDGPMLRDSDAELGAYVAGVASPFRSGIALWRSPTDEGFVLDTLLGVPATMGVTTSDFYSGPVWRWDRGVELYVDIYRGQLSSASEELVYNGANAAMVRNEDGEWEIFQFATATVNGGRSYILSNLLRGQRGTEHAMRNPVAAGAPIVFLNGAVAQSSISPAEVGLSLNWRFGPAAEDIGSESYEALAFTFAGKGRRPYSPARLYGRRDAETGDWTILWHRRTRIGGDSWDVAEVPLAEESESYLLEILDGPAGETVRTFEVATSEQLYTAAQQTADFGSVQWSFSARVAQLSTSWGLGPATEQVIFSGMI